MECRRQLILVVMTVCLTSLCCGENVPVQKKKPTSTVNVTSLLPTMTFDEMVDFMIEVLQDALRKSGHTTIQLPDIEEQFIKRIPPIKIKGKVIAQKGWLKDLSSVHRIGDATLSQDDTNMTVSVAVGLSVLDLGYDYLRLKIDGITMSGNVSAQVESNAVFVRVSVLKSIDQTCKILLDDLQITELDGLKVHVEGLKKSFDWLISEIATIITNRMKSNIRKEIESHVIVAIRQALEKVHC